MQARQPCGRQLDRNRCTKFGAQIAMPHDKMPDVSQRESAALLSEWRGSDGSSMDPPMQQCPQMNVPRPAVLFLGVGPGKRQGTNTPLCTHTPIDSHWFATLRGGSGGHVTKHQHLRTWALMSCWLSNPPLTPWRGLKKPLEKQPETSLMRCRVLDWRIRLQEQLVRL